MAYSLPGDDAVVNCVYHESIDDPVGSANKNMETLYVSLSQHFLPVHSRFAVLQIDRQCGGDNNVNYGPKGQGNVLRDLDIYAQCPFTAA